MAAAETIGVEVVYALPGQQRVIGLRVEAGTTVIQAIRQSGILAEFPQIDLAQAKVGIFSHRVERHAVLRDGDRIEIYRQLLADPKSARRERAGKRQG
jgi:putative ubiquitin-RnfH superfamily antitoxin RatB of RatAB toxin-antitoxin module